MRNVLAGLTVGVLMCAATAVADTFPNTLWLGNDTNAAAGILNTTTTGTVLRTIANTAGVGFAIDSNKLYVNSTFGGGNTYDLDTLAPNGSFTVPNASEDMTFSGGFLWSGDFGGQAIDKVDSTGARVGGFSVGFNPLGLTTDGAGGFWVSEFTAGAVLHHYDGLGVEIGTMDPTDIAGFRGGLGYDPNDGTLYIGTFNRVYHYTTTGVDLGFFDTPDSRFVDGLEFAAGADVPEPTSIFLLGTVVLAAAGIQRRLKARG